MGKFVRSSIKDQLTYVERATITTEDDLEGEGQGGVMQPDRQDAFFVKVKNLMKLDQVARVVPMTGKGIEIPTLDILGRVVEPDVFTPSTKRTPNTGLVSLEGKRLKAAFRLTRGALEENVEEESFADTLEDAFAMAVANDVESLLLYGNYDAPPAINESTYLNDRDASASTTEYRVDSLMGLFNGLIVRAIASGNVVDGGNSNNLHSLAVMGKKAFAPRYRDNPGMLRIIMPLDLEENLRWQISQRQTSGLGDMMVVDEGQLKIAGIPVVGLPLFSVAPTYSQNVTLTGVTAANLTFGYVDEDTFIVTPSTIGTTAISAYSDTLYTVTETTGQIARSTTDSSIPSGSVNRVTYTAPPMFLITPYQNIIVGLNKDMRFDHDTDVDSDIDLTVIRTRADLALQDSAAIVLVKNVQNALLLS